jgi:regulator of replication initiation timing
MDGLKGLFEEHNIDVDEETLDVVAGLEEEIETLRADANKAIVENVELKKAADAQTASGVFAEMTEGLTLVEQERFKVLSEKLAFDNVDSYKSDLATLKESFFKKAKPVVEEVTEEEAIITEDTEVKQPLSEHSTINALSAYLNRN